MVKLLRDDVYVNILDDLPSAIILAPDSYRAMPVKGEVLAVGPGRVTSKGVLVPNDVAPGDVIQFHFGAPKEFYPDKKHAILEAQHILAVIE